MVNRQETRPLEAMARFVLKPISYMFPTAITIPVETVSKAFIHNIITPLDKPVELFENKEIHIMGGETSYCEGIHKTKKGKKKEEGQKKEEM